MFFNRNGSGGVEWLLVGLGNPGSKYESTRHNMGWLALDSLMEKEKFALNKLRFMFILLPPWELMQVM